MNISAHLGALKIGTKIIFKIHLDENCSENGNHVFCYWMLLKRVAPLAGMS